jgi:hypothetical protein
MSRLLRRWFVALLAMIAMLAPARAVHASEYARTISARDAVDVPEGVTLTAPPVPAEYVRVERGPIHIAYAPNLAAQVTETLSHVEHDARTLARQLGFSELPALEVRIVPDPDTMRRLAPADAPPPVYAVGVAYPHIALTLVSSSAPATFEAANIRRVLRHELSHLLLETATGHAAIPRWFSEGVAVHQAGEYSYERFKSLALASFTRGILPLARLDEGFAGSGEQVEVAYAESADFVSWLMRTGSEARFAVLLSHLRESMPLDAAMRQTYGKSLAQVEYDWRSDIDVRFITAPLWAGTGFLWVAGMILLVVAWARRRKKSKDTLARWAREEAAIDRIGESRMVPGITFVTPGLRVAKPANDVPTIVVDGDRHTLN